MFKLDFKKGKGTRDQIANIVGLSKNQESFRRTSISSLLTAKAFDCVDHNKLEHSERDQLWDFLGRTDAKAETLVLATSCEELTHWKRLCCWEGLGARGEGDDRG